MAKLFIGKTKRDIFVQLNEGELKEIRMELVSLLSEIGETVRRKAKSEESFQKKINLLLSQINELKLKLDDGMEERSVEVDELFDTESDDIVFVNPETNKIVGRRARNLLDIPEGLKYNEQEKIYYFENSPQESREVGSDGRESGKANYEVE